MCQKLAGLSTLQGFDTEFQNGQAPQGFKIRGTQGALIEVRRELRIKNNWGT